MGIKRHRSKDRAGETPALPVGKPIPSPNKVTHTMKPDSIIIGDYTITHLEFDQVIVENAEGEWMATPTGKLEKVIAKFFAKEF